jgi:hypothetical protein
VQAFDVAVGLRAPGADLGVVGAGGQSGAELAAAELVAVVAEDPLELPAGGLQGLGDPPGEREVCSTDGAWPLTTTSSAQA